MLCFFLNAFLLTPKDFNFLDYIMLDFLNLRCDCTEKLQNKFDFLRSQLNDISSFKNIYRYAFDFARVGRISMFFNFDIFLKS